MADRPPPRRPPSAARRLPDPAGSRSTAQRRVSSTSSAPATRTRSTSAARSSVPRSRCAQTGPSAPGPSRCRRNAIGDVSGGARRANSGNRALLRPSGGAAPKVPLGIEAIGRNVDSHVRDAAAMPVGPHDGSGPGAVTLDHQAVRHPAGRRHHLPPAVPFPGHRSEIGVPCPLIVHRDARSPDQIEVDTRCAVDLLEVKVGVVARRLDAVELRVVRPRPSRRPAGDGCPEAQPGLEGPPPSPSGDHGRCHGPKHDQRTDLIKGTKICECSTKSSGSLVKRHVRLSRCDR